MADETPLAPGATGLAGATSALLPLTGDGVHDGRQGDGIEGGADDTTPGSLGQPTTVADLRMLAPAQQRALIQLNPHRIALVTHVAFPTHPDGLLRLIVRDGPTNVEVTNVPATRTQPT